MKNFRNKGDLNWSFCDKSKSGEAKKRHNGASGMTTLEMGIVKNSDLLAQWINAAYSSDDNQEGINNWEDLNRDIFSKSCRRYVKRTR